MNDSIHSGILDQFASQFSFSIFLYPAIAPLLSLFSHFELVTAHDT